MSGHISVHRSAFEHPLLRDGERFRAWFWMVAKACWKPTKFDVGGKIIALQRGQFCTSVRELATEWGWSKSAVDRFLTRLKTETMIGTDAGTGRLIITICNYETYQSVDKVTGTRSGTRSGTRAGQQRDIKEEGNKGIIEEPNGSSPPVSPTPKNRPGGSNATRLSTDWRPSLTPAAQRVVDGWPPGKFDQELARFRDHAADKGRTSKDWQAAFRTWITKANEWMTPNGNGPRQNYPAPDEPRNAFVRAAAERQAERAAGFSGQSGGWSDHGG